MQGCGHTGYATGDLYLDHGFEPINVMWHWWFYEIDRGFMPTGFVCHPWWHTWLYALQDMRRLIIIPDRGIAPTGWRVSQIFNGCSSLLSRHCAYMFYVSPLMAHEVSSYMICEVFIQAKFESSFLWPMKFIHTSSPTRWDSVCSWPMMPNTYFGGVWSFLQMKHDIGRLWS
jgi:hypothetical protein